MKISGACAVAAAAAMLLAQTAYAEAPSRAAFRSPAPTAFSQSDVASYKLDAGTAAKVEQYQKDGYQVMALTPDQLASARAGLNNTTWIIIGVVALVVIVAVAANN